MSINLLANPEYCREKSRKIESKDSVMRLIKDFLISNVNASDEQFDIMLRDIGKDRNHEIRFDTSDELYQQYGIEGDRVAYGAFRYSALKHSVQTVWTYTFEVVQTNDELYFRTDSWGWAHDSDLSRRIKTHLE